MQDYVIIMYVYTLLLYFVLHINSCMWTGLSFCIIAKWFQECFCDLL